MDRPLPHASLLATIDEARDLLRDFDPEGEFPDDEISGMASLVAQCAALLESEPDEAPIRMIHHFACTGGTLISKLIAAMPNALVLSEVDPLSRVMIGDGRAPFFAPTDLIYCARVALRPINDRTTVKMFQAELGALHAHARESGQYLVLRDHSHSHFCTDTDPAKRPALRWMVQEVAPIRSVVTVRHPLDSFLSLDNNGWRHFQPFTLEEYACRYLEFIEAHRGVPVYRYEDLVAASDDVLEKICRDLELPFRPGAEAMLQVIEMSGDSGRKASRIGTRARRELPDWLAEQQFTSQTYGDLCRTLGYDADI